MKPDVVADATGVILLATVAALPMSCVPSLPAAQRVNLQPLVATAGAYSVMEGERSSPTPAPVPTVGCDEGCECNGSGKEPSGDGLAIVNCRCPETCACKANKAPPAHTSAEGTPGWPPRNLVP